MKFAVCFVLAFCAIAAQGSSHMEHQNRPYALNSHSPDNALDKLKEFIEALVQNIQNAIDDLLAKAEDIVGKVAEKVKDAVAKAEDSIRDIVDKILEELENIAKESEKARKCVDEKRSDLKAIVAEANQEIAVCNQNAAEQILNILNDIKNEISAVQANIDTLNELVDECLAGNSNPVEVARCIAKESKKIKETTIELIKNAEKVVEAGASRAAEILTETHACLETSLVKAEQKVNVIAGQIQDCLDSTNNFVV